MLAQSLRLPKRSRPAEKTSVPTPEEIEGRIKAFQNILCEKGIDLALIRQNADLFYLTGTVQDGHLIVPADGEPVFLVWRVFERARTESPLSLQYPLNSLKKLPSLLNDLGLPEPRTIGLETDVLPASLYRFYTEQLWNHAIPEDISGILRHLRRIKSPYEIDCISGACRQVYNALMIVPEVLTEGVSELELSAAIEAELRKRGHCGLLRMRLWNQEMGMGQVVSGSNAAIPSWTNTPIGGRGPHPAFGMGASSKHIKRLEPVNIDIGGWYRGYCCDQTRLFSIGPPPDEIKRGFSAAKDILKMLEKEMKPGVSCGDIYDVSVKYADNQGLSDHFMGYKTSQVRFVGHGLGVELDEYPFIAKGNNMVLETDMIVALEPKFIFPGLGAAGVENTYRVTKDGLEQLTLSPEDMIIL